jgi:hypothetical protein
MGLVGKCFSPVTISPRYRLELALGALLASLFLLAYVALIPLVGWGLYSFIFVGLHIRPWPRYDLQFLLKG